MANWNNPTTSTLYTDFPTEIKDRDVELARGLDPNTCSPYPTNLPTNALRWTASGGNYKLQSYNGSVWSDATGLAMNTTGSAATLTNTRTFSISGDGTAAAQNFNGSANVVLSLTLGTVAVAKGGTSFSSYAIGDMIYASGTGALSKLNIGSSGQVMTSSGTAPQWVAQSSLAVGSASTATTATNLAGGGAGQIPYQNAAGQTSMLAAGTAEYILKSNGAGAPSWVAQSTLSVGYATSAGSATTAGACSGNAATATNVAWSGITSKPTTVSGFGITDGKAQGKETIWIPAGAMTPRITNGPAIGLIETTTNKIMLSSLDFDQTTLEYAQFQIRMPKSWNESTLTAVFDWSSNIAGTNAVVWGLQAVAISNDDALDTAFGSAVTVTDAQTAQGDLMKADESSAMTVGGTPIAGDLVTFQVYRDAANGSDTLAGDARLHGVTLFYTTDAANDA